ncbi:hypothetical protein WICMUC_005912 [Wickerhamomyces mucosus]|uniref:Major facilitator superfamily (MFS) profile domain-containing protein n=1 Tax=Wickerhamomyces mucosus TaxID=1378264 RepID=A0A9P8P0A0_9ASCO|nr:hypothetical protein WICMUC_005912 [Wickerhamomyces mucosus]
MINATEEVESSSSSIKVEKFQSSTEIEKLEDEESQPVVIFTPEEKKELDKIYRKLDRRIIPALWTLYFLTSFGSIAYGNTLTMNSEVGHTIIKSLNLSTKDTSLASALSTVGFIIFDLPMNIIMTYLAPHAWLSRIVFTDALVYTCYAAVQNNHGLIALRFISGIAGAGVWPGMTYYISLFYPPHRMTRRVGYYFTAAQVSAAATGLVAAGFQKMDGIRGLEGWRWMYLIYGVITIVISLFLVIWLPDDDLNRKPSRFTFFNKLRTLNKYPLTPEEIKLHQKDLSQYRTKTKWTLKTFFSVATNIRIWPLIIMYFGVVGAGNGLAIFGTTLIKAVLKLDSIDVSLLYAPIWFFDLAGILLVTPFSDMYKRARPLVFSLSTLIIIAGLLITTFVDPKWSRYGGLLIAGFGLGATIPTIMSMTADIFSKLHGDIGVAISAALVSGLGNLGTVFCSYALYRGWPSDAARQYRDSNLMMIMICGISIISSFVSFVIAAKLDNHKKLGK